MLRSITKVLTLLMLLGCCYSTGFAQAYDVRFNNAQVVCGNLLQVTVQIRANGACFDLGNSSFVWNYNRNVLSNGVLLQSVNFNNTNLCNAGTAPYNAPSFTSASLPAFGVTNLGVVLNSANNGCPTICSTDFVDVAVIQYNIIAAGNPNLVWRPLQTGVLDDGNQASDTLSDGVLQNLINMPAITPPVPPVVSVNPSSPSICAVGGSVQLIASGAGVSGTYNWMPGNLSNDTVTVSPLTTTTFTLIGTDQCGLSDTITFDVVVGAGPTPTITGTTPICQGQTTVLSAPAGFAAYLWSPGGQTTQTITTGAAGSYSVTVTDAGGCQGASAPFVLVVNPNPTVQVFGDDSFCPGGSANLAATGGFASYVWNPGGATSTSIFTNTPGSFTVTATDLNGCVGTSAPFVVTANPNPTPTITGSNTFCTGSSTTLSVSGGPFNNITWSNGATTASIVVNTQGTFFVDVVDTNGCTATSPDFIVTQASSLSPTISGNLAFCTGSSTTLTGSAGFTSYVWSSGQNTQTINVNAPGNYTLTVSDATGCTGSTTVTVVENALPTPQISGANQVCVGFTTTLTVQNGPFASILWSNGATTSSITVGAGTYRVAVTNANGCVDSTANFVVTSSAGLTPTITGPLAFCTGGSSTLTGPAGFSYSWAPGGQSTQAITTNVPGTFTLTITDGNGCTGSTQVTVVENPNPSPTITGNNSFCTGGSVVLNAPAGFASYLWSNGATTQTITVLAGGSFTVTVTDGNGCSGVSPAFVVTENPNPNPVIAGANQVCIGFTTTLTVQNGPFASVLWSNGASTNSITVGAGTYSVTATTAAGCSVTTPNFVITSSNGLNPTISGTPAFCAGNSTTLTGPAGFTYTWAPGGFNTQAVTVNVPGTYTLTITDANGCTGSTSVNVIQNSNPTPTITGANSFCTGSSATLNAPAGFVSYLWSNGAVTPSISVAAGGSFTVTVTDANGCSGVSPAFNVTQNPLPVIAIAGPSAFCVGGSATLTATAGFGSYTWSPGNIVTFVNTLTVNSPDSYTVAVTDANGCVNTSAAFAVAQNPNPAPTITGNAAFCAGGSTTLNAPAGFASYLWSDGSITQSITVNAAGTYTVTVTDAVGCSGTSPIFNVTVNPLPTPTIVGSPTVCAGGQTTLTVQGTFASILWSNGANTATITVPAGAYTATVTDANGCVGTSPVFTVSTAANITPVILGNNTICTGQSTTLSVLGNYSSYAWSNGATTPTITVNQGGFYTVFATDAFGCNGTSGAFNVIENPLPTAQIIGSIGVCPNGGTTTLTVANAATLTAISWSNGQNGASITVGEGTYVATVTDANGCVNTSAQHVITSMVVSAGPNQTINQGGSVSIGGQPTAFNGAGGFTYNWLPAVGLSNPNAANPVASPNNTNTYTVFVTDANGCVATATMTVTVLVPNVPTLTVQTFPIGSQTICAGETTQLGSSVQGGTQPYSYVWTPANILSNDFIPNPFVQLSQTTTFTLTVFDANFQAATNTVVITVRPTPTFDAGANQSVCLGSSTQIGGTNALTGGVGPFTLSWSPSNGLSATNVMNPTATPSQTTNYTLTVTDGNGCSYTDQVTVSVSAFPAVNAFAGNSVSICTGNSANLAGNATGGSGSYIYNWSPSAGLNNASSKTPTASPAQTTTYTLTVSDPNGCFDTDVVTVTVNPQPEAVTGGAKSICAGSSVQLGATGVSGVNYSWIPSTGLDNANISNPMASPSQTTTYSLFATAAGGCFDIKTVVVTVSNGPTAEAGPLATVCSGASVTLGSLAVSGVSYNWSPATGLDNASSAQPSASPSQTTVYTLTATDAIGCVATDVVVVSVQSGVLANAGADQTICSNGSAQINAQVSGGSGNYSFSWSPVAGLSSASVKNPVASPSQTTTYTLTAANADGSGCSSTSTITITVGQGAAGVLSASSLSSCQNNPIVLSASPDNASGYQWYKDGQLINGAISATYSATEAGTYSFKSVVAGVCESEISNALALTFTAAPEQPTITQSGNFLTASETPNTFYQWFKDGQPILGATNRNQPISGEGVYTVQITNTDGCSTESEEFVVSLNGLPEFLSQNIVVYPNPVRDAATLNITLTEPQTAQVRIVNALGQTVVEQTAELTMGQNQYRLATDKLALGGYYVNVQIGSYRWSTQIIKSE